MSKQERITPDKLCLSMIKAIVSKYTYLMSKSAGKKLFGRMCGRLIHQNNIVSFTITELRILLLMVASSRAEMSQWAEFTRRRDVSQRIRDLGAL
jgi:hypothetical protein